MWRAAAVTSVVGVAVVCVVVAFGVAGCGGGDAEVPAAGEPSLDQRIARAVEVGDPLTMIDCDDGELALPAWDFEGALAESSEVAAAERILDDEVWAGLDLPGGEREPVYGSIFEIGRGRYLPVLVDGDLGVLLAYDAQGPDVWSISGGLWCAR